MRVPVPATRHHPLPTPPHPFGAPLVNQHLQPDPRGPDWRASGLFPRRRVHPAPTSHVPAAALPPCSPRASENDSGTLAASLLLLALLQRWARSHSVAVEIILMLRHVMPSPPLPSSPQPLKPRRGPSPGNPPLVPKPPLQGPVRSAEAPESLSASPFPAAGRRWADSPAPRQPSRRGAVT